MIKKITAAFFVACIVLTVSAEQPLTRQINTNAHNEKISRFIYEHFAEHLGRCIYGGFYVTDSMNVPKQERIKMDVVNALKAINIPLIRWPGGCFADEYYWSDGMGAKEKRPRTVNTTWA